MVNRVLAPNGDLESRSTKEEGRTLSRLYAWRAREVWTWCLQRAESRRERSSEREKRERVAGRAIEDGSDSHNIRCNLSQDNSRSVIATISLSVLVPHLGYS